MNTRSFSAALCAAAIGLTIIAEVPLPVQAGSNLNSSKSNLHRPITTSADAEACTRASGIVVQNAAGTRVCNLTAAASTPNAGSAGLAVNDEGASGPKDKPKK